MAVKRFGHVDVYVDQANHAHYCLGELLVAPACRCVSRVLVIHLLFILFLILFS